MLLLGSVFIYGLSEAKEKVSMPKDSVVCMNFIIRQRPEPMVCTRTSGAITLHTERILRLRDWLCRPGGLINGFM
jgi:hypothetical protein